MDTKPQLETLKYNTYQKFSNQFDRNNSTKARNPGLDKHMRHIVKNSKKMKMIEKAER